MDAVKQDYRNWADVVERIWKEKLNKLDVGITGALYDSIKNDVNQNTATTIITFSFNGYGRFVDMGVGREMPIGNINTSQFWDNRQANGRLNRKVRKAKKWYSSTMFAEVKKLSGYLKTHYGKKAIAIIAESLKQD